MTWEEFEEEWDSDSPVLRCRTSGSTGEPRIIELPKREVVQSAERTIQHFQLSSESHLHSCISADFIGGKMVMVRSRLCGGYFSAESPSNHPLEHYKGGRIDLLSVVPSQMVSILDRLDTLPPIAAILIGGSPINESLRKRISASGLNAWESYGMTETASHIALRRVSEPESAFYPLPGIGISLNEDSCVIIEIQGWQRLVTNDIAHIQGDGSFSIIGRADNAFISGGIKIHPEVLEGKLSAYLPFPFMISGKPDELWGMRCVLTVENPDMEDSTIMEICRQVLGHRESPKEIIHNNVARTTNGKIRRK